MKIAVLGAGAMGSVYGGYLSQNNEVWLIDIWKEHVDTINKNGLKIEKDGKTLIFRPKATCDAKDAGKVDLVILFVKSINTEDALLKSKSLLGENTMVLSLQNGYGNFEDVRKHVKEENIIIGVTHHGANVLGPGHIQHAGDGMTYIGTRSGSLDNAKAVGNTLQDSGLDTEVTSDIMKRIWLKLLANAAGNAFTALLNVRNGFIVDNPNTLALCKEVVREGVKVAVAEGVLLDVDEAIQVPLEGLRATGANRSSMLQDVLNKRKTEIDRINGAIVTKGLEHGIHTPYNDAVTKLVKALEATYINK